MLVQLDLREGAQALLDLGRRGRASGTAGSGAHAAHVSTGPAARRHAAGAFPPDPESGSIGAFRAPRRDRTPPSRLRPLVRRPAVPEIPLEGARAVLELAADGATVPFIARYREGAHGQPRRAGGPARARGEASSSSRSVSRQAIILESIERHATLTPELRERILATFDLDALEDLYHPYRQQKKNRALAAREAGLEPLADWIWNCGHGTETPQEGQTLELWAFTFRNEEKGIPDAKSAIEGARDILVERLAGTPELRALVRRAYFESGWLRAAKTEKAKPHGRFETLLRLPREGVARCASRASSHRYLALRRGQAEDELQLVGRAALPTTRSSRRGSWRAFEAAACTVPDSPGAEVLRHAGRIAFKNDVRTVDRERGAPRAQGGGGRGRGPRVRRERAAAAARAALRRRGRCSAIDPGVRTGCKLAVVDARREVPGQRRRSTCRPTSRRRPRARRSSASRGSTRPRRWRSATAPGAARPRSSCARALREAGLEVPVVLVSEAGASVYSTSDAAREEFPDARRHRARRRSRSPGGCRTRWPSSSRSSRAASAVGQYQHDVAHAALQRALDAVVEDCVNRVGVNLNTASRHLLAHVAGHRARPRRGDRGAPREAGALPLAAAAARGARGSGPRPSSRRPASCACPAASTRSTTPGCTPSATPPSRPSRRGSARVWRSSSGRGAALVREALPLEEELGAYTWADVLAELEKPGRDPRETFVPFSFREDVQKIEDLKPGMVCPGIVSNVTSFGAFVDIGVHHDGLVHVSQLGARLGEGPAGRRSSRATGSRCGC